MESGVTLYASYATIDEVHVIDLLDKANIIFARWAKL